MHRSNVIPTGPCAPCDARAAVIGVVLSLSLAASAAGPASAAWPTDPMTDVPVCTADQTQESPRIIADGAGGTIMVWHDERGLAGGDVFAQRFDADGVAQWAANGVPVCSGSNAQSFPVLVSDGAGGAIIAWQDLRSGSAWDIYAQRISAAGATLWHTNGVALCVAGADQFAPRIVPDGNGGAIVAWNDHRNGSSSDAAFDIYAQRVSGSGVPLWPPDGVPVCTAPRYQYLYGLVPDGSGGAIAAWEDDRDPLTLGRDVYAQRIDAAGVSKWTANGLAVGSTFYSQSRPSLSADGAGGVFIVWEDARNQGPSSDPGDIYAQHLDAGGTALWTAGGTPVTLATERQFAPASIADGAGGVIVAWTDKRDGPDGGVWAQRLDASGAPAWAADGVPVGTTPQGQHDPLIVADGAGGAIVAWSADAMTPPGMTLLAQHLDASGAGQWSSGGITVSGTVSTKGLGGMVADAAGGTILVWSDGRGVDPDIYSKRIGADGQLGAPSQTSGIPRTPLPSTVTLSPPTPNPARASTRIGFALPRAADVSLAIFDAGGRLVRRFAGGRFSAGEHAIMWDLRDGAGQRPRSAGSSPMAPAPKSGPMTERRPPVLRRASRLHGMVELNGIEPSTS